MSTWVLIRSAIFASPTRAETRAKPSGSLRVLKNMSVAISICEDDTDGCSTPNRILWMRDLSRMTPKPASII